MVDQAQDTKIYVVQLFRSMSKGEDKEKNLLWMQKEKIQG